MRNWKTYGRIMTPERSAMSHEQADIEWDDDSSSEEDEAATAQPQVE